MYHLATVFPFLRRIRIPLNRDQLMLLMLALNELLLGFETYSAHIISGTIVLREWIPIIFSPIAGIILLLAGLIAFRRRMLAVLMGNVVFLASIGVGLLGGYFHLLRAILPAAPAGQQMSTLLFIWAPPLIAPLTFALIGWLGISTVWTESPPDSGSLVLWGGRRITLPLSKTRAFFFLVGAGCLATLLSCMVDHSRTNFTNLWLWVPTIVGVFTTTVAFTLGCIQKPTRADLVTYIAAMILMIVTGLLGAYLHYREDITTQGVFVLERFIRGAPLLAPMLFADMGGLGLIALFDPGKEEIIPGHKHNSVS